MVVLLCIFCLCHIQKFAIHIAGQFAVLPTTFSKSTHLKKMEQMNLNRSKENTEVVFYIYI